MLPMRRREPCSPRLPPLYGRSPTHFGATGGVDWRFVGIERCSSIRGVWSPRRGEFCIMWLAISAPRLPVNKFTILTIEDPNTIDSELVDVQPLNPLAAAPLRRPKWEKRLPKLFSISVLDVRGTSLLLPVEIGTTDTSELHSIKALLNCGATRSFINRDFVRSWGMNTQTLSCNIPVFNVDSSSNKAGQISKVVNVVLCYKTHSERMLLAVINFIWPYLHQFFDDSHGLNGYGKPLKRPFDRYQSHLEAISIGRDIRQINW